MHEVKKEQQKKERFIQQDYRRTEPTFPTFLCVCACVCVKEGPIRQYDEEGRFVCYTMNRARLLSRRGREG